MDLPFYRIMLISFNQSLALPAVVDDAVRFHVGVLRA
jgi:hypothetical protein